MRKLALIALAVLMAGCSWFHSKNVQPPTPDAVACVYGDVVVNGVTDPVQIVKDCPQVAQWALSDLEALILGLVSGKHAQEARAHAAPATPLDGGAK